MSTDPDNKDWPIFLDFIYTLLFLLLNYELFAFTLIVKFLKASELLILSNLIIS